VLDLSVPSSVDRRYQVIASVTVYGSAADATPGGCPCEGIEIWKRYEVRLRNIARHSLT